MITNGLVLLDQLIASQQRAIRYYLLFTVGLNCLGIGVMTFAAIISNRIIADAFKALFALGGVFVSSLSTIQIKEILHRKEKIEVFELLKVRLAATLESSEVYSESKDHEKINDLLYKIIEKTALS